MPLFHIIQRLLLGSVSLLFSQTFNQAMVLKVGGPWSLFESAPVPASISNLIVTEIHYHPSDATLEELYAGYDDDGEFEFFEVQNISDETVSLRGISVGQGLDLTTASGDVEELGPGDFAIYVANADAFAFRYGSGFPIAGRFDRDTSLNNAGERFHLKDSAGGTILDITYSDKSPWPIIADGYGPSMVLIQPGHRDPTIGFNWRGSEVIGGTPGAASVYLTYDDWAKANFEPGDSGYPDSMNEDSDPDRDGLSNLEELFYNTDPQVFTPREGLLKVDVQTFDLGNGPKTHLVLSIRFNRRAESVTYRLAATSDPANWLSTEFVMLGGPEVTGDGMEIHRYRSILPLDQNLPMLLCQIRIGMH